MKQFDQEYHDVKAINENQLFPIPKQIGSDQKDRFNEIKHPQTHIFNAFKSEDNPQSYQQSVFLS